MIDPLSPKGNCPHCNSSKMEYYGFTFGGFHIYYKCLNCHNYTEYRISLREMLIIYLVMIVGIVFSAVLPFFLFPGKATASLIFFCTSILIFMIIGYKYRWSLFETIANDKLPDDRYIIRVLPTKIRLPILYFIIAAMIAYIGICIYNFSRQQ